MVLNRYLNFLEVQNLGLAYIKSVGTKSRLLQPICEEVEKDAMFVQVWLQLLVMRQKNYLFQKDLLQLLNLKVQKSLGNQDTMFVEKLFHQLGVHSR